MNSSNRANARWNVLKDHLNASCSHESTSDIPLEHVQVAGNSTTSSPSPSSSSSSTTTTTSGRQPVGASDNHQTRGVNERVSYPHLTLQNSAAFTSQTAAIVDSNGTVETVLAPDGTTDTVAYVANNVIKAAEALATTPVQRTPIRKSSFLSKTCGSNIYLKYENLQKTGSYKVRGALYAISKLDPDHRSHGVVTVSAGNHAQAVAFAASRLKTKSTIFMPRFTPVAKVNATKSYGGNVQLEGVTLDDCISGAYAVSEKEGAAFIHPYDNFDVISGAGTVGVEILDSVPDVSTVIVPIGGGGLICGIASYLKMMNPRIKVYGVEASGAASMATALRSGIRAPLTAVSTICDGIAVKTPGRITTNIASQILDGVVTVTDVEVSRAMFYMLERSKSVNEPSSCVGVAALLYDKIPTTGSQKVVCVLTGGNVDMSFLTRVIVHQSYSLNREVALRGLIVDRPGTLNQILACFAEAGMGIVSVTHTRGAPDIKPGDAFLDLNVTVPSADALKTALDRVLAATGVAFKLRRSKYITKS